MKTVRILVLALLSVVSLHAAAQRQPVPIINYENVTVSGPAGQALTTEQVKQAIHSTAAAKKWEIADQGPGRALATLHVRGKHTAMTEITYSAQHISLVYKDSINLKYSLGDDGKGVIHPFYNRWVQDLKEGIRISLASSSK